MDGPVSCGLGVDPARLHSGDVADLVVGRPDGSLFCLVVKGLSSKSAWLIKRKQPRESLFYILVYVAPMPKAGEQREADCYFVLSQSECNNALHKYQVAHPGDRWKAPGFGFKDALPFKDAWDKLCAAP